MGYYSSFRWEIIDSPVKVDMEKKKEVEEFFSNPNNEVYGFYSVKIEVDKEEKLLGFELEEYYAKFYDSQLFAEKLSEAIKSGKIQLLFYGEDDHVWGYEVSPRRVEEIYVVFLNESQYNKVRSILEP